MSKSLVKTSCVLFHVIPRLIGAHFILILSIWGTGAEIPLILMMRRYLDVGRSNLNWLVEINVQPIRSPTQIWVVTGHQHGWISALVSHTSFCVETILVESRNVDCFPLLNERRLYTQTSSFVNNEKRLQIIKLYNYLTFTEQYQMKVYRHQEK